MLLFVVGVLLLALTVTVAAHSATECHSRPPHDGITALEAAHTNAPLATATVALCLSVSACFGRVKKLLGHTWVRMQRIHSRHVCLQSNDANCHFLFDGIVGTLCKVKSREPICCIKLLFVCLTCISPCVPSLLQSARKLCSHCQESVLPVLTATPMRSVIACVPACLH